VSTDRQAPGCGPSQDQLATALVIAAAQARWPAGPLLLDLDETVLRTLLAPQLAAALHGLNAAAEQHISGG